MPEINFFSFWPSQGKYKLKKIIHILEVKNMKIIYIIYAYDKLCYIW